jgi:hypothetical protein
MDTWGNSTGNVWRRTIVTHALALQNTVVWSMPFYRV